MLRTHNTCKLLANMVTFIVVGFQTKSTFCVQTLCASKQINWTHSICDKNDFLGYFQAGCFPGNFVKKTSDEAGNTGWW